MKKMKKILDWFLSLFKKKQSPFDLVKVIRSRKCRSEIKKILKGLETESFGYYKWQYRGLEKLNLTDANNLAEECLVIREGLSRLNKRERDLVTGIVGMAVVKCLEKSI